MKTEEIIVALIPIAFIIMAIVEPFARARQFPKVKNWHAIGIGAFLFAGFINSALPLAIPQDWLSRHRLLSLSTLGIFPGVIIGYLVVTFAGFLWHRATHRFQILWRLFHQMHHAPRHLNIYAANLLHPFDFAMIILIPMFISVMVLGLDPIAVAIVGNIGALSAFFQHWNVRTPQWLGYLIQRPEAHCIHHQRSLHAFNYSDFPLWDMIFGSYKNPKTWRGETGFDSPADGRYAAMLACRDVNEDKPESVGFAAEPVTRR